MVRKYRNGKALNLLFYNLGWSGNVIEKWVDDFDDVCDEHDGKGVICLIK